VSALYGFRGCKWCQANTTSSPIEVRRKVGRVYHLYHSLGSKVQNVCTIASNAINMESPWSGGPNHPYFSSNSGRANDGWLLGMASQTATAGNSCWQHGQTTLADGRQWKQGKLQNQKNKALCLLQYFLAFLILPFKLKIRF
jgi:hypothetical protein